MCCGYFVCQRSTTKCYIQFENQQPEVFNLLAFSGNQYPCHYSNTVCNYDTYAIKKGNKNIVVTSSVISEFGDIAGVFC